MSTIPDAALTQHIAVLGKTGSGKSYAVRGAAVEPLLERGERVCVIDPTGAWHGLRSSATGKSAGFPVVIFGGNHADLPLTVSHGETIAEAIGTTTTPSIIDTSLMKVGERTKFFADFADAIVRKNRGPLHLIIDEAHLFMPQGKVNDPQSGAMLHAANNMVSLGRSRGLRIILITQRPAKLHKDALTQAETLIAMRLIAPQDRAAVEAWIEDNADDSKAREIITSLATLKTGQGWIWAPELGVLERVSFPRIRTYDSGRAPDGSEGESAKVLAPIDREAIAEKLKAVVDEAKANDPKELRRRIAALERKLAAAPAAAPAAKEQIEDAYNRGLRTGQMAADKIVQAARGTVDRVRHELETMVERVGKDAGALALHESAQANRPSPSILESTADQRRHSAPPQPRQSRASVPTPTAGDAELGSGGLRRILTALAQRNGLTNRQIGIRAAISSKSGTFSTYLSKARQQGWIRDQGDQRFITEPGLAALGDYDPLPEGAALLNHWLGELGQSGAARILRVVADAYPDGLSNAEAGEKANISHQSGTFSTYLSKLRGLELISGRGELRASEDLFT